MQDQTEQTRERIERVREALEGDVDSPAVDDLIAELHPADLAEIIDGLEEDERIEFFRRVPPTMRADTLTEVDEDAWPTLLESFGRSDVRDLFEELEHDDAADILGELPSGHAERILAQIEPEESREIAALMRYDEESAGGVMTTEIVSVQESATVSEAIDEIRRQAEEGEDFYAVFVVDDKSRLRGTVSFQDLIISRPNKPIRELTEPVVAAVPARMDQEEVARIMSRYNLVSIPVVDTIDRLIGRVTFDDVMDIVEAETTEDILRFSGASGEEYLRGGVGEAIKNRLPWLVLALVTTSIAATVVYFFRETVERAVILAAIMPVIAALGGNAGTQTLAVTVRRLALSEERSGQWGVIFKEVAVGLANGAVIGLLGAVAGLFLPDGGLYLGVVILTAMWLNLIVAGFAGAFIPVILERLGIDPAIASSVFFTALTDIFGFFFLLGLASWLLLP